MYTTANIVLYNVSMTKSTRHTIAALQQQILDIQNECIHSDQSKTHGCKSNEFEYDGSYWVTKFHCHDCDKQWQIDGTH